jgi:hypothetical protein
VFGTAHGNDQQPEEEERQQPSAPASGIS